MTERSMATESIPGIADRAGVSLRPVMTLRSQLVNVKQIAQGAGVSYGWTWTLRPVSRPRRRTRSRQAIRSRAAVG